MNNAANQPSPNAFRNGVLALLTSVFLVSCNSSGANKVDDTLNVTPQNNQIASNQPVQDQYQDPRAYCPKTVIRAGTETYNVYPDGVDKDDEGARSQLLYRGTITEVVRECNTAGTFMNIRVGVRGRYLSGPKGQTGTFDMPVRVAITQGESVLYSTLHQIPATLQPGQQNGTFAYIDGNISIPKPDAENLIIYVGYDEGPYDTQ
jgi:hypothetical protein